MKRKSTCTTVHHNYYHCVARIKGATGAWSGHPCRDSISKISARPVIVRISLIREWPIFIKRINA